MPASFGPGDFEPAIIPVPAGPWHVAHAFLVKSVSPHFAGSHSSGVPVHLPRVFTNSWYSFGGRIFTVASMPEWLVPQYSAQNTCALPATVGVNVMKEYWPGTASRFSRDSGMKNECRTSSDEMIILYGRPSSRVSSPGAR